jgi:hypothetical protein
MQMENPNDYCPEDGTHSAGDEPRIKGTIRDLRERPDAAGWIKFRRRATDSGPFVQVQNGVLRKPARSSRGCRLLLSQPGWYATGETELLEFFIVDIQKI